MDAGSWFDPQFSAVKIPKLAEVIDILRLCKLAANIEIKPSIGMEDITVKKVLDVIEKHWRSDMPATLISSFSAVVLEKIRHYSTAHHIAYLMDEWQPDWQAYCNALNCISVNVNGEILNAEKIAAIKSTDRFLLSYTIDDPMRAKELLS